MPRLSAATSQLARTRAAAHRPTALSHARRHPTLLGAILSVRATDPFARVSLARKRHSLTLVNPTRTVVFHGLTPRLKVEAGASPPRAAPL